MKQLLSLILAVVLWLSVANGQVAEAEIFFNTDPGFGKGFLLRVEPGEVVSTIAELAAQSLEPGKHKAFIRVRENNIWSHAAYVGVVQIIDNKIPLLTSGDHFFNVYVPGPQVHTHPFEATGQLDRQFSISARGVPVGRNQLFFRMSDGKRKSHLVPLSFTVYQPESSFTAGEFFVNTDSGQGNAIQTPIETSDFVDKILDLKPGELNTGRNILYFRLKNQQRWSHYSTLPLMISFNEENIPLLTSLKYHFNDFENSKGWRSVDLNDGFDLLDKIIRIPVDDSDLGDAELFLKIADGKNLESHIVKESLRVCENINAHIIADDSMLVLLTLTEPDSLQWYLNDIPIEGATDNRIIALQSGTYTTKVYYGDNCTETTEPYVYFITPDWDANISSDFTFNTRVQFPFDNTSSGFRFNLPQPEYTGNFSNVFIFNTIAGHFNVSIDIKPPKSGQVTGAGLYMRGSEVTLSFKPNDGYIFEHWTDRHSGEISYLNPFSFVVADRSISLIVSAKLATFTEDYYSKSWRIFPNPASGLFQIESSEIVRHIRVMDLSGRIWYSHRPESSNFTVFTEKLADGVYAVQVETSSGIFTDKVLIHNIGN